MFCHMETAKIGKKMLDRFTSTWVILLALIGVMVVFSIIPTKNPTTTTEMSRPAIGLEADTLNRELSAIGDVVSTVQAN